MARTTQNLTHTSIYTYIYIIRYAREEARPKRKGKVPREEGATTAFGLYE